MLLQSNRIARSGLASASNHNVIILVITSPLWSWRFVSILNWTDRFVISSDRAGWPVCMACSVNLHLFGKEVMVLRRRIVKHVISVGFFRIWSCFRFSSYIIISRFA